MNDSELFEVFESRKQLNCKSTYQPVVKALVVVHLDELVQVDTVQIKDKTQVVAPNEVIKKLNHSLKIIRIIFFQ